VTRTNLRRKRMRSRGPQEKIKREPSGTSSLINESMWSLLR